MNRSIGGFLKANREESWLLGGGLLLGLAALLVFGTGIRLYNRETIRSRESAQLEKVNIARSALEPTLKEFRQGRIDRKEALEHARTTLRTLVYLDEFGPNYIFMNTMDGTILVRPFRTGEEGVRKVEFRDAAGHPHFQEIIPKLRAKPDGVFLRYHFPNPRTGKDEEKLSCFQLIPELDVMIGTGGFLDDATRAQARLLHLGMVWGIGGMLLYLVAIGFALRSLRRHNRHLDAEIQERTRAEAALLAEHAKLEDLAENLKSTLDSITDALISSDPEHRILGMNPVAERLTGWTSRDAIGRPVEEVFRILDAQTRKGLELPISRAMESGEPIPPFQAILATSAREPLPEIEVSCASIRDHVGSLVGNVLVFRDVTEENLNREELAHAQRMDAIGQLAGGVAHDFNNMLGGILGIAEFMQEEDFPPEERNQHLGKIVAACQRAAELSSKLLAFARKGKTESTAVDLHGAIESSISLLKRTIDKRVEIIARLDAKDCCIIGDGSMLMNAFLNLGINAQHAMPKGGRLQFATWNTTLEESQCRIGSFHVSPGRFLVAEVADTGTGIAPEHLERIFEPYFTTKEAGKGTGLGLAAVYGIMTQHHGAVEVSSTLGVGATFRLYFPVAEIQDKPSAEASKPPRGKGIILLVDDEELIRTTAKAILERLGYRVMLAGDGVEGLALFTQHRDEIDLVVLDMIMPRMDGRECFFKLRELAPTVPVLLASGFSQSSDLAQLQKGGISGFLRKPFNTLDLSRAVNSALQEKDKA